MLVNKSNFDDCFRQLCTESFTEKVISFDTETTALFWWQSPHYAIKPRVFSQQFSTAKSDYYFDFGCTESLEKTPQLILGDEHFRRMKLLFESDKLTWFIHNAKFDMHHMANHGIEFAGKMHCTQAIQRIVNNLEDEKKVSLDALSEKYFGANKVDLSEYWKPEDGRATQVKRPGENGNYYTFLHFDKLPLDKLVEYGERDTRLCYKLGLWQQEQIRQQNETYFKTVPSNFGGSLQRLYENECELTKTLWRVERRGVKLDLPFIKEAHQHGCEAIKKALGELDEIAAPYLEKYNASQTKEADRQARMNWNSGPMLKGLFDSLGLVYSYTEKGTASFDKDALEECKDPVAKKILEYRRHSKRVHTYLENYLWLTDTDGVIHCSFAQGGPQTGRMSCREPNMQNVPKRADKKEADFVLRKCFIPREGYILVSNDYDQGEYRLMLDYAREHALIKRIIDEGLDIHEATSLELAMNDREAAKTMNFQILYGGGVPKLAYALLPVTLTLEQLKAIWFLQKWPRWTNRDGYERDRSIVLNLPPGEHVRNLELLKEAEAKLDKYFTKLPNVEKFVKDVKKKAKEQGVIFTWLGRILRYGKDSTGNSTDYKAPNGLIQGGLGDVSKVAMVQVDSYLRTDGKDSHLLLQVHDELLSEVHKTEVHLVPRIGTIMETVYPHRLIPLTAGVAWSEKSWGDLKDGLP